MTFPVTFTHPAALLLLPLILLAVRLGRRRSGPRWRIATALRAATLGLLILALSGPVIRVPVSGTTVMFAVDRSLSISPGARDLEAAFLRGALARMHPRDRAGIVTFGARPALAVPLSPRAAADDLGVGPEPDATDIGAALDLGLRVLPPDGARRIVLLSDGDETRGDAAAVARRAAAGRVPIDVVPVGGRTGPEVAVEDVVAPAEVRVGEAYEVRVILRATAPAGAAVTLRRNGAPVGVRRVQIPAGDTAVRFPDAARTEGPVRYTVDVDAAPDTLPGNNHGAALVTVRGRPLVLFVSESSRPLAGWLARQGLRVEQRPPAAVPALALELAAYASVVLDDVPAFALSRPQQEALRAYARDLGGGVVAIGGPHAYGVGGYAGTPLEDLLPVRMDVRQTTALPTVAVALVIDTSGSMEAFGKELAKEELAKEIAASVIDHLGEHDQIGVVAFHQEYQWLVPLTEVRERARILDRVSRLTAGGGTVMYPPLAAAREALRASPAKIKHVIVLSDGLTDPGDFRTLALAMARDRITVSTVAIGGDADLEFMRNLASWGGGRAYVAKDLYSIPEIFTTEAFLVVRSYIVEEPTLPQPGGSAPTLAGISPPPALEGYVATFPKPAADVALAAPKRDPLLATWRYGLGRTVAFTSDDGLRWTTPWGAWPDAARFWSQAVRWTLRDPGAGLYLTVGLGPGGTSGRAVLEARRPDGAPWDGLAIAGEVRGPDGAPTAVRLEQTAPGRYEAAWAAPSSGIYAVGLSARDAGRLIGTRTAGLVLPYSPELRVTSGRGGRGLLANIAEATGGRILGAPEEAFRAGRGTGAGEAWPPLAALALGSLLAEVTVRRVPAIAQHLAAAGAAVVRRVRGEAASPAVRAVRAARKAEDAAYAAADRWAVEDARFAEEDRLRAQSMEQAGRLYIARLRGGRKT